MIPGRPVCSTRNCFLLVMLGFPFVVFVTYTIFPALPTLPLLFRTEEGKAFRPLAPQRSIHFHTALYRTKDKNMSSASYPANTFLVAAPQSSVVKVGEKESSASHSVTSLLKPSAQKCNDVLRNMLRGRWHQDPMTAEEIEELRVFYKQVREQEYKLPKGGQRADKRCGNINAGRGDLQYFKAVCDPDGDTPCCYNYVCQNKTVDQCKCANCEDMRTPIHAEHATWRPVDPACQPHKWSVTEICQLLGNSTIHFIGDSLMRHLYTAFLLAARGNFVNGAFKPDIPDDLRKTCSGLYMFSEKVCRLWVDEDTTICNGSVKLRLFRLWSTAHTSQIHSAVLRLQNTTRSFVLFGIGLHDELNAGLIKTRVLQPLLQTMKSQRLTRPRLLWASVHHFGMMKTPLTRQNNRAVEAYNKAIKDFLNGYNVSVFDTYNLTDNVMSFDDTHYGYGLDSMKVTIFLHYCHELRTLGKW